VAFNHIFNCVYWTTLPHFITVCGHVCSDIVCVHHLQWPVALFWFMCLGVHSCYCVLQLCGCAVFFFYAYLCFTFFHMHCCSNHIVLAHFFCLTCPIGRDCMLLVIFLHFVPNTVFCCLFCWLFSCMLVFSCVFAVQLPIIFLAMFPCKCVVLCSACWLKF
jgi:hypothetical protein